MRISVIVAMAKNGVIGKSGSLPWWLPADLKRFKRITMGHAVVMGRKTYQSIGRALPGRTNVVVTRQSNFRAEGCLIAHSLKEALTLAAGHEEVFFIGGAQMYVEILPQAQRLYMTLIEQELDGDVRFPPLDLREWRKVEDIAGVFDSHNLYPHRFLVFERK